MERSHYDYREGQNPGGLLPICANLTGEIERDLRVAVRFHAGTAKREFMHDLVVVYIWTVMATVTYGWHMGSESCQKLVTSH